MQNFSLPRAENGFHDFEATMPTTTNTESQISEYFMNAGEHFTSEKDVIAETWSELAAFKAHVSEKDMVLGLIHKLESETDATKQDIYRQALEIVLQRTPGEARF
ncbi:biofilm development regulator YmgB/AriR family protein [Pantoea ananatis]|uniref:biofilm development regulator YmgB/AriR family protein n=1 Tax=Pantoea ananas TaxID=553 RepID=UPI003019B4E0